MRGDWQRRIVGALVTLSVGLLIADIVSFAREILPQPAVQATVPKVDLIVVLTGGRGRLKEAIALLERGMSDRLFISGVEPSSDLHEILDANQIGEISPETAAKIRLGIRSRSTSENALEVSELVANESVRSLLLVTSTYHMRRARELVDRVFDAQGFERPEIHPWPVETPNFDRDNWWFTWTGWRVLISEYFKNWLLRF